MRKLASPINTADLCSYGCGQTAKFINASNNLMCCQHSNSCPENRKKNSEKAKLAYNSGKRCSAKEQYESLPEDSKKRMAWATGLTKEIDPRVARPELLGKKFGAALTGHTEETKKKLSKIKSEWLKNPLNRKNLGRHKRSWMELTFEQYLCNNNIVGWETEIHFWNDTLKKNYFPDFIFEDKKLIIELDGTQHQKTIDQDKIRDQWFKDNGYTVVRITHSEFKERYFSGRGFLDVIADVAK